MSIPLKEEIRLKSIEYAVRIFEANPKSFAAVSMQEYADAMIEAAKKMEGYIKD